MALPRPLSYPIAANEENGLIEEAARKIEALRNQTSRPILPEDEDISRVAKQAVDNSVGTETVGELVKAH